MFKKIQKALSVTLVIVFILSCIPVEVRADEYNKKMTPLEGATVKNNSDFDAENMYLNKILYDTESTSTFATHSKDALTEVEKEVYNAIKPKLQNIGENGGSTKLVFDISELPLLGQKIFNDVNEVNPYLRDILRQAVFCLCRDIPESVYWTKGSIGWLPQAGPIYAGETFQLTGLEIYFPVLEEYRVNKADEYSLDPSVIRNAIESINNAKTIAKDIKNNGKSRIDKLRDIKNKICELTDYNYEALDSSYVKKDAWQIINVFDNDPTTKVVCEGYAKSFQYLSDLVFADDQKVEVYCVSGMEVSENKSGLHMWNIVRVDNMGYHVDPTFCDGWNGSDTFFMLCPAAGTVTTIEPARKYIIHAKMPGYIPQDITYQYEQSSLKKYGDEVHTLATEHNYGSLIEDIPSTNTKPGKGHRLCQICGSRKDEEIPIESNSEKFDILGTTMTMGNDLSLNFYVEKAKLNGRQDVYAKITRSYSDGSSDTITNIVFDKWIDKKNNYSIPFNGLSAKEMNDKVSVQIMDNNGHELSTVRTDSIHDYALRMLQNPKTNELLKTCFVDMLNYGAEAQKQFNYDVGNLANKDIDAYQDFATKDVPLKDIRVKGANYYGTSLSLKTNIRLGMYFTNIDQAKYAMIKYTNHHKDVVEYKIDAGQFVRKNSSAGKYTAINIDRLLVSDVSQPVTCEVYDASNNLIGSATDSVESYCARMKDKGSLYIPVMKFGVSARTYFGNR